jgi:hypothetical protein
LDASKELKMSFARDDLNVICHRLTSTLREIEDRMSSSTQSSVALPGVSDIVELSAATMAADKMRYAAHFGGQTLAGAASAA